MVFRRSSTQYTPMAFREDDDGKRWVQAVAHAALTAKTGYLINAGRYGWATQALASGTVDAMVGFPDEAYSTGDVANMQIGGYLANAILTSGTTYTAAQYLQYAAGAYASSAADNVAGVIGMTATTASGTTDIMLAQTGLQRMTT